MRAPPASSPDALRRMQRQVQRDTKPELALRSELHRLGLRYYVHRSVLPGLRRRADVVFTRAKVAVFVDGCFWHGCPEHATMPKANAEWWAQKLSRNVSRDRDTDSRLRDSGWTVVRFWEHDDMHAAAESIHALVTSSEGGPQGR
jgi:DNA mismatch endonuclease, patch repair protein